MFYFIDLFHIKNINKVSILFNLGSNMLLVTIKFGTFKFNPYLILILLPVLFIRDV